LRGDHKLLLVGTHLVAGAVGAVVPAALALYGMRLNILKHNNDIKTLQATPFDVSDQPEIDVVNTYPDKSKLYHIVFRVSAKIEDSKDVTFSYSLFSADILTIDNNSFPSRSGLILDAPPNPLDGVNKSYKISGRADLEWRPLLCSQNVDTADIAVRKLLSATGCTNSQWGGGMTGVYPPASINSYSNGFLVRARPGDFIGLSTAFGVANCSDPDGARCSLSQEIVELT